MSRENPLENKEIFNYYEIWDAIALSFLAVHNSKHFLLSLSSLDRPLCNSLSFIIWCLPTFVPRRFERLQIKSKNEEVCHKEYRK